MHRSRESLLDTRKGVFGRLALEACLEFLVERVGWAWSFAEAGEVVVELLSHLVSSLVR
jgi:hypothetical protein